MSRSKCGEFQDGNFKPLITKIHDRYLDHFFCAAVVAVVASTVLLRSMYLFIFYFFSDSTKASFTGKAK